MAINLAPGKRCRTGLAGFWISLSGTSAHVDKRYTIGFQSIERFTMDRLDDRDPAIARIFDPTALDLKDCSIYREVKK